jgi:hypothetical protein
VPANAARQTALSVFQHGLDLLAFARQIFDPRLKLRRGTETQNRLGLLRQDDPQHRANPPLKRIYFGCCFHALTLLYTSALYQRQNVLEEFEFLAVPAFAVVLACGNPLPFSSLNPQPPADVHDFGAQRGQVGGSSAMLQNPGTLSG